MREEHAARYDVLGEWWKVVEGVKRRNQDGFSEEVVLVYGMEGKWRITCVILETRLPFTSSEERDYAAMLEPYIFCWCSRRFWDSS